MAKDAGRNGQHPGGFHKIPAMRFLLINPFYPLEENPSPPLGVGYLAAALERGGVEVRVLDQVVSGYSAEKLEALMSAFRPDIVGATSVTMTFLSAIGAIEDAKRIDPDVVTAMGGAHVSFCAEKTLRQHPGLDLVAMGEGEELVLELCDAVAGKRSYASVAGLVYRDGDEIRSNGRRDTWIDVCTLPLPARHLTPLSRYRAINTPISMTTSRGCPFQCIFCVGRQMVGAKIRRREPNSVVDEMVQLASLGFSQVNLADDLFTAYKPHAYAVCDEILRRGLSLRWTSFANVNTVDVPLLTRMREAGCTTVSFGLESANQKILETVKKGTKVHRILAAVDACNAAGVQPHGSFIIGLPGETPETIQESIELSRTLADMGAQTGFHMLAPFPGTAVREQADEYGVRVLTDDWSQYHANHAITETPWASRDTQEHVVELISGAVAEHFWELSERVAAGAATDEETVRYAALERQGVFYDMMQQDVLETRGSWRTPSSTISREEAVAGVVGQVAAATHRPHAQVERAIRYGLDRGLLRYTARGGVCTWQFADSPESLSVTEIARRPPAPLEGPGEAAAVP